MPHALIVDDSKTARYALRLLLDKQHFTTDMVESAEQALDYLNTHAPDLIFMDHMMPGMDGFQAVKAIKSNRSTAGIPIVMYTSTQGGVYFGQARALGAADVISKPASAEDLAAVLKRLAEHRPLGADKTPAIKPAAVIEERSPEPIERPTIAAAAPPAALPPVSPPEPRYSVWAIAFGLALLVVATLWVYSLTERSALRQQRLMAFKAVEWAINQTQEYPYGEPPFGGDRLTRMQELMQQLSAAGFHGTVRVESHVGEFCLLKMPNGEGNAGSWVVAPPELHLTDCTSLGQSIEQSKQMSASETTAFRRFRDELPPGITLDLVPLGATEPKWEYPTDPNVSAAEWNRIAQRNHRIQIALQPSPDL